MSSQDAATSPAPSPILPNKTRASPPLANPTTPRRAKESTARQSPRRGRHSETSLINHDGPAGRRRSAAPRPGPAAPGVPVAARGGVRRRRDGGKGGGRQGDTGRIRRRRHQAGHRRLVLGRHHLLERVRVGRYVLQNYSPICRSC
jgi:hypothetical protein